MPAIYLLSPLSSLLIWFSHMDAGADPQVSQTNYGETWISMTNFRFFSCPKILISVLSVLALLRNSNKSPSSKAELLRHWNLHFIFRWSIGKWPKWEKLSAVILCITVFTLLLLALGIFCKLNWEVKQIQSRYHQSLRFWL